MHQIEVQIPVQDRAMLWGMSWSEAKNNDAWRIAFEGASKIYNQTLLQDNDASITKGPNGSSEKLLELPPIFRLEEDGDVNVFYVNASLAQHPTDFAMLTQQQSQPSSTTTKVPPDSQPWDFKLAITKCTILQHAMLHSAPVTKMKLQPLTGRRHQLRCHMVVLQAPIVGDVTYERMSRCPQQQHSHHLVERISCFVSVLSAGSLH